MDNKQTDKKRIGNSLKTIRELKGYTQLEISVLTGISKGQISEIERGLRYPSLPLLIKLKQIYGEKIDVIIDMYSA